MRPQEMSRRLRSANPDLAEKCEEVVRNLNAEADCENAEALAEYWGNDELYRALDTIDLGCREAALVFADGFTYGGAPALAQAALIKAARGDVAATVALRSHRCLPAFC